MLAQKASAASQPPAVCRLCGCNCAIYVVFFSKIISETTQNLCDMEEQFSCYLVPQRLFTIYGASTLGGLTGIINTIGDIHKIVLVKKQKFKFKKKKKIKF